VGFHTIDDYIALPRSPHAWIVQDVLPTGGLVSFYGRPKVGKSYAALQLANAIGDPDVAQWLGLPISQHGRVAYLQVDTPRELWVERVVEVRAAGLAFPNVIFADDIDAPYPFNILTDGHAWLKNEVARFAPDVIIVDTLREIHDGDENDSAQMKQVISMIRAAARHAAIIFIAHSRKGLNASGGGTPVEADITDEMRGSGYVPGRMDCILRLTDKTIQVKGRAIGDTVYAVSQDPETHLLHLSDDFHRKAREIIARAEVDATDRELARLLHAAAPKKSYEACRSLMRRLRG